MRRVWLKLRNRSWRRVIPPLDERGGFSGIIAAFTNHSLHSVMPNFTATCSYSHRPLGMHPSSELDGIAWTVFMR